MQTLLSNEDDGFDAARRPVLEAVLAQVPFEGWSRRAIETAAAKLVIPVAEIDRLFPDGAKQMIAFHSRIADIDMVAALERAGVSGMKIRDRIRTAVRCRLEANSAHREAIRHALAVLASPLAGSLGARLLYRTVDAIWYAAGDTSTDFNFYTKRGILAAVYSSTLLFWLADRSPQSADSWAFLDRRIDNVMQFEKLKARLKNWGERTPREGSVRR